MLVNSLDHKVHTGCPIGTQCFLSTKTRAWFIMISGTEKISYSLLLQNSNTLFVAKNK